MKIYKLAYNNDIVKEISSKYPIIDNSIDGLEILNYIPNLSSIESTLQNYYILDGIRKVPMSDFNINGKSYSVSENKRIKELANQIATNRQIAPLIVVIDKEGAYILEGVHRIDALFILGISYFPAIVVIDND